MKLQSLYNLTEEAFIRLLTQQKHSCATCPTQFLHPKDACVDHCHTTGIVRGLLCVYCNRALGHTQENPQILRNLAKYIEVYR